MVVSLLLLVFLTILGITATSSSRMELNMTRNSQEYKRDFYVADSGWRAAAMDLQGYGLDFPPYPEDGAAGAGSLNGLNYTYTITPFYGEMVTYTVGIAGNSGAMQCGDAAFDVTSTALDPKTGLPTQTITARLNKVCCVSY
jgi:hypothetical protein